MKSQKIGILFTSRNNYELLDNWMEQVDTEGVCILNIDEDSIEENKKIGIEVCKKHDIFYMDREERGMLHNITTAGKYFKSKDIDWIVWFQHDCFPLTENFFSKLNDTLSKKSLQQFGVIGFNAHHKQIAHKRYEDGIRELNDTARSPLEVGDFWYRRKEYWVDSRANYANGLFDKPFAVESVAWYASAINIDMYTEHIIPTGDYHFFHAWDDIAFQFLNKNIYNICLPNFDIKHHQQSKKQFNIPVNSPKAGELREHYYGKWSHLDVWQERWGFDYMDRLTFEAVKSAYKDTLLWEFYHHDPENGPLKSFDI
jgi:hypothetical protein